MPFDTTYHILPSENNTSVIYTVPGGNDTDIYLGKGQLPPGMDSFPDINELLKNFPATTSEKLKEKEHYKPGPAMIITFLTIFIYAFIRLKRNKEDDTENNTGNFTGASSPDIITGKNTSYLTYYGEELNFSDKEIAEVLHKRFEYYSKLSQPERKRFVERLQLFMADKIFKIHCNPGFKEMPILISAAAVQLTFGLRKYLLPNFKFIHVYPHEFVGVHPSIRVLEGNVSSHSINFSWKHFLEGYKNPTDGQNVGLHELAHALYYQTFVAEESVDNNFRDTFDEFNITGNKVFNQELMPGNGMYSEYALKNFQEFWAESMEIFFEKPHQLKNMYPALYTSLVELLNQDPSITTTLV
jgi:Mlc titration factor MtfA (ptsG expression regulator)